MQENNQVSLISSFRPSVYQEHFFIFIVIIIVIIIIIIIIIIIDFMH